MVLWVSFMDNIREIEDAYNALFFFELLLRAWVAEFKFSFWTNPFTVLDTACHDSSGIGSFRFSRQNVANPSISSATPDRPSSSLSRALSRLGVVWFVQVRFDDSSAHRRRRRVHLHLRHRRRRNI